MLLLHLYGGLSRLLPAKPLLHMVLFTFLVNIWEAFSNLEIPYLVAANRKFASSFIPTKNYKGHAILVTLPQELDVVISMSMRWSEVTLSFMQASPSSQVHTMAWPSLSLSCHEIICYKQQVLWSFTSYHYKLPYFTMTLMVCLLE